MKQVATSSLIVFLFVFTGICRADTRSDFLKIIDRPRVPLDAKWVSSLGDDAPATFSYATDATHRVPGILLGSSSQRKPVVIVLHGTGGNKNDELPLLRKLAARGFVAISIDAPHHGQRSKLGRGNAEHEEAFVQAYKSTSPNHEHPFFYDTVWDVMRLVDYLETRPDVDAKRIGLMGISKGGIETYLTAAVDQRIAAAVPCIGVQSFKWALDNNDFLGRINTVKNAFATLAKDEGVAKIDSAFVQKVYDKVVPGIYSEFDGPAMLPLIAPRPLLSISGENDDHCPLPGVKIAAEAARKAYKDAGAEDHFVLRVQEKTGHRVNPDSEQAAIEWFAKWLKP